MAQSGRINLSSITDSKMFAKKMHRLVKKMQDKPAESLDPLELLSEMARKRGENLSIPIEVETESQWTALLKREGLIVVDVFSGWSGPCTSMFSLLRKLKLDTNDDRLILAAANADNISQLAPFRNQSEPCWLFVGGGKPVNVLRGSNAPKLVRAIKSEFQYELECIEGKQKRQLISIKYEASRREKAVNEAIALDQLIALEEAERKAKEKEPSPEPISEANEENENEEDGTDKENLERVENMEEETETPEENEHNGENAQEANEVDEMLKERRKLMEQSNERLKLALRKYTVIAIQSYLLETGAVTEIKDHLSSDFNLVRERYISLTIDDARKLFGIPAELPDLNPTLSSDDNSNAEDVGDGTESKSCAEDGNVHSTSQSPLPLHAENKTIESNEGEQRGKLDEHGEEKPDGSDIENSKSPVPREKKQAVKTVELPVPEVLIGDTLILLLDCTRVQLVEEKAKVEEINEESGESQDVMEGLDEDADYFISQRIGPEDFEMATETQPESLHAMYGREKYVAGIWCPRKYEEKRFVMLNYFPQFVTEMLTPAIPEPPKYQIFVFSALFATEILEHPE